MEISNIPALLRSAFAEVGDKASIPLTSVSASRASFDVGFPALNMTPLSSGGVPPDGRDMNGILYAISQAALWAQAMGVMPWDTAFASAEGYPNGALVQHSGAIWRSKANNNAVAPSAASVAWERVSAEGGTTGQALVKASNKNGDWSWKALAISDIQGLQATIDNNKVTFSAAAPAMDGAATPGTSAAAARADHVHPTDTTRAAAVHGHAISDVSGLQAALDAAGLPIASAAQAQAGTDDTTAITPKKMRDGFNAAGSAPIYACRAWVNFNGTGTVAIRASGNVSSITDNGVGNYTVNFTTAMPDANYAIALGSGALGVNVTSQQLAMCYDLKTTDASIWTQDSDGSSAQDASLVCAAFFR